jgi:hypothetical protein
VMTNFSSYEMDLHLTDNQSIFSEREEIQELKKPDINKEMDSLVASVVRKKSDKFQLCAAYSDFSKKSDDQLRVLCEAGVNLAFQKHNSGYYLIG